MKAFVAMLIFTLVAVAAPQGQRGEGQRGQGERGRGQSRPASTMDSSPKLFDTAEYKIRVVTIAEGLSYPYCFTFLPDGSILVAEMAGRLRLIRDGKLVPEPIGGMPKVYFAAGQGGLMDVALHPNFAQNHLVYFTYNKPGEKGATMAIGRGAYDGSQLTGVKDVFVANAWGTGTGHLSARLAFGRDGALYMAISDHGMVESAQEMDDDAGKVLRIREDSAVPAGYRREVFTMGHRNPHALVLNPQTGDFWEVEHGDEINILKQGGNYGWPYISSGEGNSIGPPPAGLKLIEPYMKQFPVLNISGLTLYTGGKFPKWKGNVFVGGLNTQQVHRVVPGKDAPSSRESLFTQLGQRVRDVRTGPDGFIYFTTDDPSGRVMRIEPAN
jgi:glucose/arabinose dehydrogenase